MINDRLGLVRLASLTSAAVGCDLGRSHGVSTVGRVVSGREPAEAFTPTDAEVEWARTRTQDQQQLRDAGDLSYVQFQLLAGRGDRQTAASA
ncbi:hypothetical protein [Sphaerisporangium album]|uniref:hypothetical protein n=1 Tax=Sphaerisporangium album TaxID=509200 RepID=UPI0011C01879|nr:hypothetical protein [Sphaerisporangium album]